MDRAERQATVDARLRRRNLVGDEGASFGVNEATAQLAASSKDCPANCSAFVVFSLVPAGDVQALDPDWLREWASSRDWPRMHPLAAEDVETRTDGLVMRTYRRSGGLSRHLYVARDGYVEWSRALGGCHQELCVVRLGPLLWAVHYLCDLLRDLCGQFEIEVGYELVISIPQAKGTCLSHLGVRWLDPWFEGRGNEPKCSQDFVQFRTELPPALGKEEERAALLAVDEYLNRTWGVEELRGHNHPSTGGALREDWRDRDPWE